MVYRIFVEKKESLANEANTLKNDLKELLRINELEKVRVINRYDVENISEELFSYVSKTVLSEPQLDIISSELKNDSNRYFAVEYLPGQFDQRADSAAQCIQIISKQEKPLVKTAKVYIIYGNIDDTQFDAIKKYVINPVEAREASMETYKTLKTEYAIPESVETIEGFCSLTDDQLKEFITAKGLAMDFDDIKFCQNYFKNEKRNPTITEIKMIDTYWSDHCRHTTFSTTIDTVKFEDKLLEETYNEYIDTRKELNRTKPINLMDIATIAVKYLKAHGKLEKLDESEEINACTVKMDIEIDGKTEKWLLLFKNETHNHPTEIEPFGGAATCIGGAIRDPLSGRAYVYSAMRVTGAADPTKPITETIKGKLPQRKIVTTAAAGYSSYGNQIGLATGLVDEIYHDGYAAKRMEIGAVVGAVPAENVRRECPLPGDIVILLGGRTGRDGCGGATGSSKSHNLNSLETCGAEVQKGNAPEERKLQRLFRNKEASLMIKICNDFGAGGVSVAIGELADGLEIDLNKVPKKYEGLDGTELAISESQERMAVVVGPEDVNKFISIANSENLEATVVAEVKEQPRLVMHWNNKVIVDISREFLNSNGAEKHIDITLKKPCDYSKSVDNDFITNYLKLAADLNVCSKRGLSERFDSTIGAGTVLMPFGGKYQITPPQAMVTKVSVDEKHTDLCSVMAYGYNPYITEKSPYHGAYLAVIESVCKLIASGAEFKDVYLTFQEYFEKPSSAESWGKPLSALLGAFKAQKELEIAAIGGKDSMSGTFENIVVPPTLVSFAITTENCKNIISPEFKKAGHKVYLIKTEYVNGLPDTKSLKANFELVNNLVKSGVVVSAYTPTYGGVAEAIMKMCFGNRIGFAYNSKISIDDVFGYNYGAFVLETTEDLNCGILLGDTTDDKNISVGEDVVSLKDLQQIYENKLEPIFNCNIKSKDESIDDLSYITRKTFKSNLKIAKPKVVVPVFPGTNCEYDTKKAWLDAGADCEVFVVNNLSSQGITESVKCFAESIKKSQIIFIPGGFSGGDEPDGSGKFITAFFRNPEVKDAVTDLLEQRDGLICGICNGFQALIKLGLVPYGKIIDTDVNCPILTYNTIGRHQSKIVRTKIVSNNSPWLSKVNVGDVYNVPISHGEGRFIASSDLIKELAKKGQIASQYVDLEGNPTYDIAFNPNGSDCAIEGILSADGRIFGKMGHSERIGKGLYKNVKGEYNSKIFESAVEYYK